MGDQMNSKLHHVALEVNGKSCSADVPARTTLVDFLRDELRLTGTHVGCEHGTCGACTVMLNGEPIRSCLAFAVQLNGEKITTVEGLCKADGSLSVLQDSFCSAHAQQCGYCTPGMLISAQSLLNKNIRPTEPEIREAISSNLCRCTGYQQIVDAVKLASERLVQGEQE
ncbi:MAG: carbon monoxide dehydrogenase [Herminiimonas sp.]|nr:carbon monoxide dehydrogenase [Herminiimonas sp.]